MGSQLLRVAALTLTLLSMGCGNDAGSGSGAVDAGNVGNELGSVHDFLELECPWRSYCGEGDLEECFSLLNNDDLVAFYDNWVASGLSQRYECLRNANSCSDYRACSPDWRSAISGDTASYTCPGDAEIVCDSASQVFMWCLGDDGSPAGAGTRPAVAYDLTIEDKTCSETTGSVVDDPPASCVSSGCDGQFRVGCQDSERLSTDCKDLHPDFVCVDNTCTVASPECEGNSFNNSGGSAQCTSATIATVCMAGKEFTVDCAAVGAACANSGDLDAMCM